MKGITPIISIIILLLITIAMAYSAWNYMGGIMTGLTAKVVEIPTQKCVGGTDVMIIVKNIGTETINIDSDMMVFNGSDVLQASEIEWCELSGSCTPELSEIEAGKYAKAVIKDCTGTSPKTCSYDLVLAGRSHSISVPCSGG